MATEVPLPDQVWEPPDDGTGWRLSIRRRDRLMQVTFDLSPVAMARAGDRRLAEVADPRR